MKSNFIIRSAEFEDVEAIFNLIKKYPEKLLPRSIGDIIQNIDRFFVCNCDLDGRVVGVVSWQILPEIGYPKSPSIEIKSLVVEELYRNLGIGRSLLDKAINHIKKLSPLHVIVLTFFPDFFRKYGFMEIPKEKLMHKIYMGCINCAKHESPFTCPEIAMCLDVKC